jgi:chromosomal replication initiator protein
VADLSSSRQEAEMQVQEASGSEHWNRVKKRLRAELGDDVFSSWFARVDLEEHNDGTVRLSVPTRFLKQWIQSHYNDRLMGLWQRECENVHRIELTVRGAMRPRQSANPTPSGLATPKRLPAKVGDRRLEGYAEGNSVAAAQAATAALGRGETEAARDVLQGLRSTRNTRSRPLSKATPTALPWQRPVRSPPAAR